MKGNTKMDTSGTYKLIACAVGVLLIVGGAPGALASGSPWMTVGSAGTVDEGSIDLVNVYSGIATISAAAPSATSVTLRYNIVSSPDLEDGGVNVKLKVRFRDNGADAKVEVRLRRYNINNGGGSIMLTFNSDDMPASGGYQTGVVHDGCSGPGFDFDNYAYYLEVVLTRDSAAGLPAFSIAQVSDLDIC